MRQLSEIEKDIKQIDGEISLLRAKRGTLEDEQRERVFADFCEKYGVKRGDIVRTERYGDVVVCEVDRNWRDWIKVRKIKKNGEPYMNTTTFSQGLFDGCKVIGHINED